MNTTVKKHNSIRQIVAIAAIVVFVLVSLIPVTKADAAESYGYDPQAAVEYAAANWHTEEGVCDEFVKACLSAGGVDIRAGGTAPVYDALQDAGFATISELQLADNEYHIDSADNPGTKAGDVLFIYCEECEKMQHLALIAGFDEDGHMQAYGHNPSWDLVDWFGNFKHKIGDNEYHAKCYRY